MAGAPQTPPGAGDNKGPIVLGFAGLLRPLAVIVILLRLATKARHKKTAGWDDACIAVSAVLTSLALVFTILEVNSGYGRHIGTLPPEQVSGTAKWGLFAELFHFADLFFIRTSVCFFTHRLLPKTQKWSFYFVYAGWLLNFASTLCNMISFGIQCQPTRGLWDHSVQATCFNIEMLNKLFYTGTVLSVIADFIIVIVPMTVIRHVQMSRSIKIGVFIILSLSFITAGLGIGKCVVTRNIKDPSYDSVPVQMFSTFEENLGIIFASVPALRQLYLGLNKPKQNSSDESKPSRDVEEAPSMRSSREKRPPPSLRSNHSSGIFGKSTHKSIIRHNFETHRKLHDIAGHASAAYSTLARAGSGGSHESTQTATPFTVMGCHMPSPIIGQKHRQDSLVTLLPDKPRAMSVATSVTGLRKEGQCAPPIVTVIPDDKMSVKSSTKSIQDSHIDSPISPSSPTMSPLDHKRISVSPIRQRATSVSTLPPIIDFSVPMPKPLSVASGSRSGSRAGSLAGSRRGSEADEPKPILEPPPPMPAARERKNSLPTVLAAPPPIPAAAEAGHERKGSRNKLSLPFPIRTARSADNLSDQRKKTQSLAASKSRFKDSGAMPRSDSPAMPPPPKHESVTSPKTDEIIGVTRQAKSMQPPKRPPRSPLFANPVPPVPTQGGKEGEGMEKKGKRDTLCPEDAEKAALRMSTTSNASSFYAEREGKALPPPPLPPPPRHLTQAREGVRSLYF